MKPLPIETVTVGALVRAFTAWVPDPVLLRQLGAQPPVRKPH